MLAERETTSSAQTSTSEMDEIRRKIVRLHGAMDELTAELRTVEQSGMGDVVRRAEEAGAALARLQWALERASDGAVTGSPA